ncbi:hypothetical protein SAY86_027908 [Trapa natans]|uniref:Peptidase A1 domain-containing protein n=1 Tax=Trapa natans TaxID=22666 RepID=A0AAN7M000_TRANT|nr:hypothetical protein SAY86_027908 [Trapa natans]
MAGPRLLHCSLLQCPTLVATSFLLLTFLVSPLQGAKNIPKHPTTLCDIHDHLEHDHGFSSGHHDLRVFHVFSPCSPFRPTTPWEDSILDMQNKDVARLWFLSSLVAGKSVVPIAWGRQQAVLHTPTYIIKAKVGTPPKTLFMAMDTSNDAAWIPCSGCVGCSSSVLLSTKSTTFKALGCSSSQCLRVQGHTCDGGACTFNTTYGSSTLAFNLSQDTLKLAADPIPGYTFACIQKATGGSVPPQGLLGLGRGPLSLLSQTESLYKSTFSYCLPNFRSLNFSGSLRLGPVGQPLRIRSTPLLTNPRRSSLYYVNLIGVRVGRKVVDIPPAALAFNPSTGAGTIFDSGTVFTRLVRPVYEAVRNEFQKQVGKATVTSLGGFDTCYTEPIVAPAVTFMFPGLNMTLPPDNLLIHSTVGRTSCLAMAASPDNLNSVLNVIASMQQQNFRVLFDLHNSRLGVARQLCT